MAWSKVHLERLARQSAVLAVDAVTGDPIPGAPTAHEILSKKWVAETYGDRPPSQVPEPEPAAPPCQNGKTAAEVLVEMLAAKTAARGETDRRPLNIQNLKSRVGAFARHFGDVPLLAINGPQIQQYVDALVDSKGRPVGQRTKINHWRIIRTFWRWAVKKRYLPKTALDELDYVEPPAEVAEDDEPEVFTPEELREILTCSKPGMVPFIALGAFAGLRSEEIRRLNWEDIDFEAGEIAIRKGRSKTGRRRSAPVLPALRAWLAPHFQQTGNVLTYKNFGEQIRRTEERINKTRREKGETADFDWRHNALRHTFISCRVKLTQNIPATAAETGTSVDKIETNYKALVTEKAAKDWFSVMPESAWAGSCA